MTVKIERWPFLPMEARSLSEAEWWWEMCYRPAEAEAILQDPNRSVVLCGRAGSGKSVAAAALARPFLAHSLVVDYPVIRWPGERHAWLPYSSHLSQMMACGARCLLEILPSQPERLTTLSATKLKFLRWLIEKYTDPRALLRLADKIKTPAIDALADSPFDDFYQTDTAPADVQGQIEDLVNLAEGLGFESIMMRVDLAEGEAMAQLEHLQELFEWLEPLQHPGFTLKVTLPETVMEQAQVAASARGRVALALLIWTREECLDIANRHLKAATAARHSELAELVPAYAVDQLAKRIEEPFGQPTPRAWVRLTELLLERYAARDKRLSQEDCDEVVRVFYIRHVPLKLDRTRHGVWRGQQFIALGDQPFSFLEALWQTREQPASEATLLKVARKKPNVHTLANRVRKKIEPVPGEPVYLLNSREQGYWLENLIDHD